MNKKKSKEINYDDCPIISVCDGCGKEIDDKHTYIVSISYPNCRGDVSYDFCGPCFTGINRIIAKILKGGHI